MTYTRKKYEAAFAAFAAFAAPGGRWENNLDFTYWGKAAGLSADELIADARAARGKSQLRANFAQSRFFS